MHYLNDYNVLYFLYIIGEIKINIYSIIELSLYCLHIRLNFFDIDNEIDQINDIICFNLE